MSDDSLRQVFLMVFAGLGTLSVVLIVASLIVWMVRNRD